MMKNWLPASSQFEALQSWKVSHSSSRCGAGSLWALSVGQAACCSTEQGTTFLGILLESKSDGLAGRGSSGVAQGSSGKGRTRDRSSST